MLLAFSRYLVSGSLATLTHFGVLILLVEIWGTRPTLASAIGFTVSIFVNYTLQYHWTFRSAVAHRVAFARYLVVTVTMLGVNTGIFWCLNELLGVLYILSQVVATGIVFLFNFTINHHYTFSRL
jgi:putative flippase GtrA